MRIITKFTSLVCLTLLLGGFGVACTPLYQDSQSLEGTSETTENQAEITELAFTVVPSHSFSGRKEHLDEFLQYLEEEIGIPVKLHVAESYDDAIDVRSLKKQDSTLKKILLR